MRDEHIIAAMAKRWNRDPWGRNEYRWFNGKSWTDLVMNGGHISSDPPTVGGHRSPPPPPSPPRGTGRGPAMPPPRGPAMPQRATPPQRIGFIGGLAAAGTGYAVLIYLGIPSIIITMVAPQLGAFLCALTVFVAIRAGRRVGRATQRGVTVVSAHIQEALGRFMSDYRAYQQMWGQWTPPGASGDGEFFGDRDQTTVTADAMPSPFEILGIPEGASLQEAQAAFHRLMLNLHPDLHMNDTAAERARLEDQAKVVSGAYNAIKEQFRYTKVG